MLETFEALAGKQINDITIQNAAATIGPPEERMGSSGRAQCLRMSFPLPDTETTPLTTLRRPDNSIHHYPPPFMTCPPWTTRTTLKKEALAICWILRTSRSPGPRTSIT